MLNVHEWMTILRGLDPSIGIVLAGIGLVLILQGHRLYAPTVVLTYGAVCLGIAYEMLGQWEWCLIAACAAGVAGGALGWLLKRFSVALLGGAAGMVIASSILDGLGLPAEMGLVVGVGAFVALTAMAFVNWVQVVVFVTSLEGGLLLVAGAASLMTLKPAWFSYFHGMVTHSSLFLPFAVFFPTATGYFLQLATVQGKESGGGR